MRTAAGVTWLTNERHGTATTTIDAVTQAAATRYLDSYGNIRAAAGTWPTAMDRGFVGGLQNESGLITIGVREYDPDTGRFVSVDPAIDTSCPQALEGYAYANNNPQTFTDPTGKRMVIPDLVDKGLYEGDSGTPTPIVTPTPRVTTPHPTHHNPPPSKPWWQSAWDSVTSTATNVASAAGSWAYQNRAMLTGVAVGIGCAAFGVATAGVGAGLCLAGAVVAGAIVQDAGDAVTGKGVTVGGTLDGAWNGLQGYLAVVSVRTLLEPPPVAPPAGGLPPTTPPPAAPPVAPAAPAPPVAPAPPPIPRIILPGQSPDPIGPIIGPNGRPLIP